MRIKSILLGAGAALILSAGAAGAATVTTGLNLRSGPGTGYRVVDTMPAGAHVAVVRCNGAWCRVNWNGEVGYASASFITGIGYASNRYYYSSPYYDDYGYYPDYAYDYGYQYDYGWYGPGIAFGFGGSFGHHHHFRGGRHHHFAGGSGPGVTYHHRNALGFSSGSGGTSGGRNGLNAMGAAPGPQTHGTVGMSPGGGNSARSGGGGSGGFGHGSGRHH
jgi:hypothetical protein